MTQTPNHPDLQNASTAARRCLSLLILVGLGVSFLIQDRSPAQDANRIAEQAIQAGQFDTHSVVPPPKLAVPATANVSADPNTIPPSSYRRVPPFFAKVGISQTQRETIYRIRKDYRHQITALQAQIDALAEQELKDCEAVLNPQQRLILERLRTQNPSARNSAATAKSSDLSQNPVSNPPVSRNRPQVPPIASKTVARPEQQPP